LVAAWLVALVVATLLTWQIVSFADSRVGAEPLEIGSIASTSSSTSTVETSTSTTLSSSTTDVSVPSSSTPQTSDAEWSLRTVNTSGGRVVIRYRPEQVELQAATPAPGFEVELDDTGPQRVRVEFESEDRDIRVEARWANGSLDVEVSESG
jgi:cytoskeletal protein RodZ